MKMTLVGITAALIVGLPARAPAADHPSPTAPAKVEALMTQALAGDPSKEIQMLTVEYGPGGASLPHRHNAQVLVYVLEGTVRMQVRGAAPVTLNAGGTFYESPGDVHVLSQNPSETKPARILVVMIKDKSSPVSVPAASERPAGAGDAR